LTFKNLSQNMWCGRNLAFFTTPPAIMLVLRPLSSFRRVSYRHCLLDAFVERSTFLFDFLSSYIQPSPSSSCADIMLPNFYAALFNTILIALQIRTFPIILRFARALTTLFEFII
jgi:hypothetical protein